MLPGLSVLLQGLGLLLEVVRVLDKHRLPPGLSVLLEVVGVLDQLSLPPGLVAAAAAALGSAFPPSILRRREEGERGRAEPFFLRGVAAGGYCLDL